MVKLLIIADDFTGALDTGVQFAASGAETRVVTNINYDFDHVKETVQVLVLDAETRHLDSEDAYNTVFDITKRACRCKIPYIYKKTDSALRGNIGSELKAVLDAAKYPTLHFLPALPKMNRITKDGIHYVDGVSVHESIFGKDLFEPVTCSYIPDMMPELIPVTVVNTSEQWQRSDGIMIYDAAADEELLTLGKLLMKEDELHITAGCAGFGAVLPELLGLTGQKQKEAAQSERFLIACGSVNPITKRQLDFAEQDGFIRIRLNSRQKLDERYYRTKAGIKDLETWKDLCMTEKRCMLDTNDLPGRRDTLDYAEANHMTLEELRVRISTTLGYIVKELVNMGVDSTLLITGGDCLVGFMKHIGCDEITPVCEMAPGTVLSKIETKDRELRVISKSGGFGTEQLFTDLAKMILDKKVSEEQELEEPISERQISKAEKEKKVC
ncbi:MAG: four-carbon acid sugar kinase family protein [Clostridium sp.]